MKKIILLLCLLSSFAYAQVPAGLFIGTTDVNYYDPTLGNGVWRSGTSYTAYVFEPTYVKYNPPTWKIVNLEDSTVVAASGTGRAVAGADEVYDLSGSGGGDHNGANVDYSSTGRKIFVKGTGTRINFFYYKGGPLKPIHIIYDHVRINYGGSSKNIAMGSSSNVIIDGLATAGEGYGVYTSKIDKTSITTENAYFTPADNSYSSANWVICGIQIGGLGSAYGGSGFVIQMTNGTFNDSNYTMDRITVFHCKIENNANEGFYAAHTTDYDVPAFSKISHLIMHDMIFSNPGNEGIQPGGILGGYIFNCTVNNGGTSGVSGQRNIIAFKGGSSDLFFFWNKGWGDQDMIQTFNQLTGKDIEVFACQFETQKVGVQFLFRLSQTTAGTPIYFGVYNNIFKCPTGPMFQLYNDVTYPVTTQVCYMYADGNISISNTTTNTATYNSWSSTNTIMNNKAITSTSGYNFTNEAARDYRPTSSSGSQFSFSRNSTTSAKKKCIWQNFDMGGNQYVPSNIAAGCWSGVDKM